MTECLFHCRTTRRNTSGGRKARLTLRSRSTTRLTAAAGGADHGEIAALAETEAKAVENSPVEASAVEEAKVGARVAEDSVEIVEVKVEAAEVKVAEDSEIVEVKVAVDLEFVAVDSAEAGLAANGRMFLTSRLPKWTTRMIFHVWLRRKHSDAVQKGPSAVLLKQGVVVAATTSFFLVSGT